MSDVASSIREALNAGLNLQALDLARDAKTGPADTAEIRYLAALASARIGAVDDAEKLLAEVERDALAAPLAVEVWSLAGRIAKERFAAARDRSSSAAREHAVRAIENYSHAHAIGGDAYPAVNAATMALLVGDAPRSHTLAQQALSALRPDGDHWQHATSGEALLVLGRVDEARARYTEAYRLAGPRFGDIASMRRQLALIGSDAARDLAQALPPPQVIAFSGHMIDHPARPSPRFPPNLEPQVGAALRERIASLGPSIGFAQAACGADILFLEAMQDAGMQTQVVLPFPVSDFIASSVSFAGDAWIGRFERVVAGATRVVVATEEGFLDDDVLFEHAANLIQGMAYLRAVELGTHPLMLSVLERDGPDVVGGTAATASNWTRKGGRIDNIDIASLRGVTPSRPAGTDARRANPDATGAAPRRLLRSLLFADISGFSRMPEQYAPRFAELFLGTCKRILDSLAHPPVHVNTLGDGIFLVFDLPTHAAEFALLLQRETGRFDWPALGLAAETGVRIALHTGPLFRIYDPVTARHTFYGTHVNRTARLEPIVQPQSIFVTEEFAASLIAEDQARFTCDYIGTMPLARRFGDSRLYRLRLTERD